MLILTRRVGERITIGDEIVLSILEVRGQQVRVGVQAPPQTRIHREEIYLRIQEENLRAAEARATDLKRVARLFGARYFPKREGTHADRHKKVRNHRDR